MSYLEREKGIEQQYTFLYSGDLVQFISEKARRFYALRVSYELALHPHTMLQFTPKQILESINKGFAVLALGENMELAGFARLWQYGFNDDGQQILEFGSWLNLSSRRGLGEKILKEAVILGKKIDPKAQIVAIVEEDNTRALGILSRVGGIEIGTKFQPAIRTVEGEAAFMKIFDITNV